MYASTDIGAWFESNTNYFIMVLNQLHEIIENYVKEPNDSPNMEFISLKKDQFELGMKEVAATMTSPPALEQLCQRFKLSEFERFILVFCAGIEIDVRFSELCAEADKDNSQYHPTFALALSALPNPHWSALAPDGALRYWKLIDLGSGSTLTSTSLHINERILHYLIGVKTTDSLLTEITELPSYTQRLIPSHQCLADSIKALWELNSFQNSPPIIQLCGSEMEDKTDIAQAVCQHFNLQVSLLNCHRIPLKPDELETFIRRLERECILERRALLLVCEDIDRSDKLQLASLHQLLEELECFAIVTTLSPLQGIKRQIIRFDVPKPLPQEQLITWQTSVAELKTQLNEQEKYIPDSNKLLEDLQELTSQFQLSTSMIRRACAAAVGQLTMPSTPSLKQALWQSCRIQARPGLDELAERIESKLSWEDLVLPPLQKEILKEISAHVRQKSKVYEKWGFASKSRRGLGITALFSGPSGTGKTLAAGVLANELNLDLYRIELSAVVSKYIGETEKNLQQIFNAAESGGVILLFDEADSIFGKRSEVKDSKDRNANLEVSYLLQRMESYPGMAILTTNLQSNLDPAFMRRLRFVTQFSLPDAAHRAEIWRRIFPPDTPTECLNFEKLAQLNAPGGNIRIIALNSAFMAADAEEPVQMKHILKATQTEYEKLGKSLTSVEISGWI
ncbi:AAA+-type ATPase, SpoVK/Ycf46/Vps4 family [Nostoc flagelliforme CCNUN1]|uniref:AAA+-type ATPase, SpoVK/Ycf46/Vps4 family n=1 Tax=Nostoc flagelliforme CCNUN1 TaxID=2038116 RepID=A0A2K8T3K1_9NOSO|nr:AAA family ATPase [Nostoc flagelliforme]AUB42200.1 AAA+-type ATPase, SpoVK/Ycf46/Vps4 family [Nostoc flagelliforme CCNUN1]